MIDRKEYYKQWYEKNREKKLKKDKEKYAPIKEANRIKREKEKAEKQKYYEEHKEEIDAARIARRKEWWSGYYKKNKEKLKIKRREYYKRNPEPYKAATKKWLNKKKMEG